MAGYISGPQSTLKVGPLAESTGILGAHMLVSVLCMARPLGDSGDTRAVPLCFWEVPCA